VCFRWRKQGYGHKNGTDQAGKALNGYKNGTDQAGKAFYGYKDGTDQAGKACWGLRFAKQVFCGGGQ